MSGSVNKVTLLGNLGLDPEVKVLSTGTAVCNLSVATNETWVDERKGPQERAEWHRVQVWGRSGEACGTYLRKGSKVYIEGRIHTRAWEDKEGKKQYTTEIVASSVIFLDGKKAGSESTSDQRGYEEGGR